MCNCDVTDSYIKPGVYYVDQFNGALEFFLRPTLVAMVTKI